jgi:hypothetical protein
MLIAIFFLPAEKSGLKVILYVTVMLHKGRAITQAVSRWLPTAAARVRARVWTCGICGGQSSAGAGFLIVLRFPLPIFVPPIASQSQPSIIWGWYNRPVLAAVPSGLSLTPLRIIIKITIMLHIFSYGCETKGRTQTEHVWEVGAEGNLRWRKRQRSGIKKHNE